MIQIKPEDKGIPEIQALLQGGIAPRPIALVSTVSAAGVPNLSPFSFYNVFSSSPPVVGFSAARRGRDATLKDTYNNLLETGECVINAVTFDMVEQISLASHEFGPDVNEFIKCGLSPLPSIQVRSSRVRESPFQMECKLSRMIRLGTGKGAGNLALCEVILFHVSETVFTNGIIDPQKIDLASRMSADFYCRASGTAVFSVAKPGRELAIGVDMLPDFIFQYGFFTGPEIAKLAGVAALPDAESQDEFNEAVSNNPSENQWFAQHTLNGHIRDTLKDVFAGLRGGTTHLSREAILEGVRILLHDNEVGLAHLILAALKQRESH